MRRAYGSLIDQILLALKDYGPMTRLELEQHIGITKAQFGGMASRLTRAFPTIPQRAHICGYVHDHEDKRRYPRAIYAYGPGENKPKPKLNTKANKRRYYHAKMTKLRSISVFHMGMRRDDLLKLSKHVQSSEVHMGSGS